MKRVTISVLAVVAFSAIAHDEETVINQASELIDWCRLEAQAPYIAKGITPYNWTAAYHDRSNVLYVDGGLRVEGNEISVHCRVAKGGLKKDIVVEIKNR